MVVYGGVIALTTTVYLFFTAMHYEKKMIDQKTVTFFFISYLFLLCARDFSVGVDTSGYVRAFEYSRHLDWKAQLLFGDDEIGFKLLRMIVTFFGGARLYIIVAAVLTVLPVMYLYRREAEGSMICISFFLISLLFEMFFSGMRQSIAIAMAVPAYYFVKDKKVIKFLIIVALACCFHKSAIILLLLYPVYHAHITKRWLWGIIPLMGFVMIRRDFLMDLIFQLAGDEYAYKYSYLTGSSGQIGLMVLFLLLAIYSYVILDEDKAGEEEIGLRNILLLATFIHLFTPLNPTISRINYYFILFIPAAISRINNRCRDEIYLYQLRTIATFVMPVFFVLYFFLMKDDSLNVFNYKFYF